MVSGCLDYQPYCTDYTGISEAPGIDGASHISQYPSDTGFGKFTALLSCHNSGSYDEIVSSLDQSESIQTASAFSPISHRLNYDKCIRKNSENARDGISCSSEGYEVTGHGATTQEDCPISGEGIGEQTLKGTKRKKMAENQTLQSKYDANQSIESDRQKDVSLATAEGPEEKDEKKLKRSTVNDHKPTDKRVKDHSSNGDTPNQDYVHVRARRGQATNSHSLAERIRREKISERMKLLQDLVPGCNKINGKAVVLDEIINYVQSLQQQVEFLSMKLSTVNPELNFDLDKVFSNDTLHLQSGGSSSLGFGPGMSVSQLHLHGFPYGSTEGTGKHGIESSGGMAANSHSSSMPQIPSAWDDELQTLVQTSFITNPPPNSLDHNGHMKLEL